MEGDCKWNLDPCLFLPECCLLEQYKRNFANLVDIPIEIGDFALPGDSEVNEETNV